MKFGFRKPSIKKRITARTSMKRYLRHNIGLRAPQGFGWFANPRRAAYSRIYNLMRKSWFSILILSTIVGLLASLAVNVSAKGTALLGAQSWEMVVEVNSDRGRHGIYIKRPVYF